MESDRPLIQRIPWIAGMICLALCEVINFVAMSLAPVSIITPLGSFSVIASAVFGYAIFGEIVTKSGIFGIALITLGTVAIVVSGPSSSTDFTVEEFKSLISRPIVISYFLSIIGVMALLGFCAFNNLFGILGLASVSAANSIILSKALSTFVKVTILQSNQLTNFLPYGLIAVMAFSIVLQVHMVNRALKNHKCYIVNSLYFVMLTVMSIVNATVVYGEMVTVSGIGVIVFIVGGIAVVTGVYLLALDKDEKTTDDEKKTLILNKQ
jgi:multidrug transporter EmrE-like cation transporter